MLNANSLLTRLEIGEDLASEARGDVSSERNTPTQKAQHVGAAKRGHRMLQQARVQLAQVGRLAKDDVDRPFALIHGPVVMRRIGPEQFLVNGVDKARDA